MTEPTNWLEWTLMRDRPPEWNPLPENVAHALTPRNGLWTPEQLRKIQAIADGQDFLLRNDGPNTDKLRCRRCNAIHEYFTLGCVERPFRGRDELIGLVRQMKDPNDELFESVTVGSLVPISPKKAQEYRGRIIARGYQL